MSRLFQFLLVAFLLSTLLIASSALRSDSDSDVDVDVDVESEVATEAEAGAEAEAESSTELSTEVEAEADASAEVDASVGMGAEALATLASQISAYQQQLIEEHGVSAALIESLLADPKGEKEFAGYHKIYAKSDRYAAGTPEYKKRAEVYSLNKAKRITHNAAYKKKAVSYKVAVNKFSDVLPVEMRAYKGAKVNKAGVVADVKAKRSAKSAKMDALLVSDQEWEQLYVCAQFPQQKCSEIRKLIGAAKKELKTNLRSAIMDYIMKKFNKTRDAKFISSEAWEIAYVAKSFPNYSVAEVGAAIAKAKKQTGNNSRDDIMAVLKKLLPGTNKAQDDALISSQIWELQYVAKQFPDKSFEDVKANILKCKKSLNSNSREKIMLCLFTHYGKSRKMDAILVSMQDWEVRYVAQSFPSRSVEEVRKALLDAKKKLGTNARAPIMEYLKQVLENKATTKLLQLSNRIKASALPSTPVKVAEASGSGPAAGRFNPRDETAWCPASKYQMDQDIIAMNTDVWPPVPGKDLIINITVSNPNVITGGKLTVQLASGSDASSYSSDNSNFKILATASTNYLDGLNSGRSIGEFNVKGERRTYSTGFSDFPPSVYSVFIALPIPANLNIPSYYKSFVRAAIDVNFSEKDGPKDNLHQVYCFVSAAASLKGSDNTPAPAPAPLPTPACGDVEAQCDAKIKEFTCNGKDEATKTYMQTNCAASCKVCVKEESTTPKPVPTKGFSWVEKGMVLDARDQQRCMCCWSFAVAGAIESNYAIQSGTTPVPFSEESLLTCMKTPAEGCNEGEYVDKAIVFASDKGISTRADAPWTTKGARPSTCPTKNPDGRCPYPDVAACTPGKNVFANSSVKLARGSSASLRVPSSTQGFIKALEQGPIAVTFDASDPSFQTYKSGIYDPPAQRAPSYKIHYDHAVLAVAWGETDGKVWVLLRNSWGPNWGDKGFFKAAIDAIGITQIAYQPVFRKA